MQFFEKFSFNLSHKEAAHTKEYETFIFILSQLIQKKKFVKRGEKFPP